MRRVWQIAMGALAVGSALVIGCDEGPLAPRSGTLVVAVYDGGNAAHPVPDVLVEVTPVGRRATTGDDGTVTFQLAPGGYYVDADVCCAGPGPIQYHRPVTLVANQTTTVTLNACLACEQLEVSDNAAPPARR